MYYFQQNVTRDLAPIKRSPQIGKGPVPLDRAMRMGVRNGVQFTLICVHMINIGCRSKTLTTRMAFTKRQDCRYYINCHGRHQSKEPIEHVTSSYQGPGARFLPCRTFSAVTLTLSLLRYTYRPHTFVHPMTSLVHTSRAY